MHKPDDNAQPITEVMVRIIEENLWCGKHIERTSPSGETISSNENLMYLREKVFPTLVPALHEMLRREQNEIEQGPSDTKYGATGNTDPIAWLAQFMLRNNTCSSQSKIRHHPYSIVNSVELARLQENMTSKE